MIEKRDYDVCRCGHQRMRHVSDGETSGVGRCNWRERDERTDGSLNHCACDEFVPRTPHDQHKEGATDK